MIYDEDEDDVRARQGANKGEKNVLLVDVSSFDARC